MKSIIVALLFVIFCSFFESSLTFEWKFWQKKSPSTTTEEPNLARVDLLPEPGVCGLSLQDKIYGGKRAEITDFPWMVQIGYAKPNNKIGFH